MPDQLLSTDPKAGRFLSDDPKAGAMPPPLPIDRDATGRPRVSSNLSDAPDSSISQWFESHLRPALESAAHPQTLTDIASLLLSPTDATRGVGIAVLEKALANMKTPAGAAVSAAGRGMEMVGKSRAAHAAEAAGMADAVFRGDWKGVVAAAIPSVMRSGGRGLQKVGAAIRAEAPAVATDVASEAVAAPAAPAASAPAAPVRPPPPAARTAAPESMPAPAPSGPPPVTLPEGTAVPPATAPHYPQKFLNEVAIQARRQGLSLSDGEYAVAHGLTQQGASPAEAVQQIRATRAAAAPEAPPAAAAAPKLKLVGQEQREYLRLRNTGLSHQQAEDLILAQRAMSGSLNLPSGETVRRSVAARNASGKWGSDK